MSVMDTHQLMDVSLVLSGVRIVLQTILVK